MKHDSDPTGGVVPYKNPPALFAYYLAIFSIICGPLGIASVILGFIGLQKHKQNPAVHGVAHAWIGIILGGVMVLINIAILLLLLTAAAAAS